MADDYLTTNFCEFFWSLMFAALISPVTILSLPFQLFLPELRENDNWTVKGRLFAPLAVIFVIFLMILLGKVLVENPVVSLSSIGVLAILFFTGFLLARKSERIGELKDEAREIFSQKFKSVKENYCPKIEWK
jgi:hypothetical protein